MHTKYKIKRLGFLISLILLTFISTCTTTYSEKVWIGGYWGSEWVASGYWGSEWVESGYMVYEWVESGYMVYEWVESGYEDYVDDSWVEYVTSGYEEYRWVASGYIDDVWNGEAWVPGWIDTSGFESVWVDTSHVTIHIVKTRVWVDTSGLKPVWVDTSGLKPVWVDTSGFESVWVDTSGFESVWISGYWEDNGGEQKKPQTSTKEPIDTQTGNNYFTEDRLYVPCPGIPLELKLEYQSKTTQPEGLLGRNWLHSYEWALLVEADHATLYTGVGEKYIFDKTETGYLSPDGNNWTLQTNATGGTVTLPGGGFYDFNTSGYLTKMQDAWSNQVTCFYGTNGCLESVTHSNGRQLVFSNQWQAAVSNWRIASITVPDGASLAFAYNSDGVFTQVVEQVGGQSSTSLYQYGYGYLTNKVNGAGHVYTFNYEEDGNGGFTGKGTYLAVDGYYEHSVEYVNSNITDVAYSARGQQQRWRYSYDEEGLLSAKYGPSATTPDETLGTRYSYAGVEPVEETLFNAVGETWTTYKQYDAAHNVTNLSVAYGAADPVQISAMEYDPIWKLPVAVVDAEGGRVEMVYTNGLPLIVKAFYSDTQSYDTLYGYNTNGWLTAVTNANGHVAGYTYDSVGNVITVAAQLGPVVSNRYNSLGFTTQTEVLSANGASSGRSTQFARDAKGRITGIVYADGLTSSNSYNVLDYLMNTVDRAGRRTEYTYAPTKKLASVTQYLEQGGSNVPVCIAYDYDQQLNTLRITEPRGRYVESYNLDIQDRITAVTNIEGQTMSIDYGIGSFVKRMARFDGSIISNTYDTAGRKSSVTYLSPGHSPLATLNYSYYADSKLKTVSDGATSVSNGYDRLNRVTGVRSQAAGVSAADSTLSYGYDAVGNVTNSVILIGNPQSAIVNAFAYDNAERLTSIQSRPLTFDLQTFDFAYSPQNGRISSITNLESGIVSSYAYDIMDRVTNINYRTASGILIRGLSYQYDALGMITNRMTEGGGQTTEGGYEYDSINRLVSETRSTSNLPPSTTSYAYDLAGNRLSKTVDGMDVAYATIGVGDRIASWRAASATGFESQRNVRVSGTSSEPIGTDDRWGALYISNRTSNVSATPDISGTGFQSKDFPLEFGTQEIVAAVRDEAGNMGYTTNEIFLTVVTKAQFGYNVAGCITNIAHTGTGEYSFSMALDWDECYRLTSVSSVSSVVNYSYDVLGRRIGCSVGSASQTNVEQYVYDGNQVVADLDASGKVLRSYVWGLGIDNLLSMTVHGTTETNTYYALKDHLNSVLAFTDASGIIVESYEYDAWGRVLDMKDASGNSIANHQSAIGNRYLWQGREYDFATGLYYFRARWYDPVTGRWLSKDPIGISGGLNLYVFCGNNPVNMVDPSGLDNFSLNGLDGYNPGGAGYGQNAPPPGVDSSGNVVGGGQFENMVVAGAEAGAIGLGAAGLVAGAAAIPEAALYVASTSPVTGLVLGGAATGSWTQMNIGQMINAASPYAGQFISGLLPGPGGPFASRLEAGSWFAGFVLSGGSPGAVESKCNGVK